MFETWTQLESYRTSTLLRLFFFQKAYNKLWTVAYPVAHQQSLLWTFANPQGRKQMIKVGRQPIRMLKTN